MSDTKDMANQAAHAARPKRVTLREAELASAEEAHEELARKLRFPEYYGYNLDALEDCLGDIARPTRIVLVRDAQQRQDWFDALEEVVRESAQRSCYLGCTIR